MIERYLLVYIITYAFLWSNKPGTPEAGRTKEEIVYHEPKLNDLQAS